MSNSSFNQIGTSNASDTIIGATKLSVAPASAANPIALGVNDPMITTNPVVRTYLNASSPATWTKPAGLKYVVVEVQAGGANGISKNSGGGAGGYTKKTIVSASLGATETITIGAVGGNSSFGAHCSATGTTSQTGGSSSGGDLNITGEDGSSALSGFFESTGRANSRSGRGGSSVLGRGGAALLTNGGSATGYGSGGACAGGTGSPDTAGSNGSGTAGIVIVTEYYM